MSIKSIKPARQSEMNLEGSTSSTWFRRVVHDFLNFFGDLVGQCHSRWASTISDLASVALASDKNLKMKSSERIGLQHGRATISYLRCR